MRIRELREQRGLTQEAFAEEAEISYKYYQAIEAGRKIDLRISTLERLAKAHGLEVWELLLPQMPAGAVGEKKQAPYGKPARRKPREK
ncbi:MAG TPA: helix-turn-helix transcriptional regulator [Opitutaceae bacterium]|nr:helix-turn-helix transcriptional regulator [Opitutaceae bacterium]